MNPRDLAVYALLVGGVFALFHPVLGFDFVDLDDYSYVVDNARVAGGLTFDGLRWAFTQSYEGYWAPLTWISYMADAELSGLRAGAFHATNVLLHAASACILFAALKRMTAALWPSALVAAVFAFHPLHVESVAWIAERKDVLSTFFYFVALWTYARYVERPSRARYATVVAAFGCGLMAKPMVLTLPVVLLLLDWWPYRRRAFAEKVPLLVMSAAAAVITIAVQRGVGAVVSLDVAPPALRVTNALVSCVIYLRQTFWPTGLAALYPYPRAVPLGPAIWSGLLLAAISTSAVVARRRAPYLLTGWLWYVVTLLPVLGFVQAGPQARADRYTYIAMTGIAIAIVWGLRDLLERFAPGRTMSLVARGAAVLVLGALAAVTWNQLQYWRNTETLFRRALAVTTGNYVAHKTLGSTLVQSGRHEEGIRELLTAIALAPDYVEAHADLGRVLLQRGDEEGALTHFAFVSAMRPDDPEYLDVHLKAGSMLATRGRVTEAVTAFSAAVRMRPDDADVRSNLGVTLASAGRLDEAIEQFSAAVRLRPDRPELRKNLDLALEMRARARR